MNRKTRVLNEPDPALLPTDNPVTEQPEAAKEPEQPKVTPETKVFKVVPLDRSGLPSFPSSRESACRDLENYLNNQAAEGYHLLTVIDRNVGVQPIKLLVFKAI